MTGLRIEEPKRGGGFALSLLAHGAVIAGFAAFAAPRPGLPQPELQPITLLMVPAAVEAPAPMTPAPVQSAPDLPAPVAPPPEPSMEIAPPVAAALPPPPPVPEALPLPEPPPVAVAAVEPPPPVKVEPAKVEPKPAPKPAPRPTPKPAATKAPVPAPFQMAAVESGLAPSAPGISAPIAAAPSAPPPAAPAPEIAAGPPVITEPRFREPPVKPAYPPRAAALDQQGEALVRVLVTPEGEQEEVQLWRSSGFDLLDRAALAAVRRWRFEPYRRDGIARPAWVQVPVRFALN